MDSQINAVIDLGTNTFNLLIGYLADEEMVILHSDKEGVGLGLGGINEGFLADDAIQRALETLSRFCAVCKEFEVVEIKMIGTSAIRDAKNNADFSERVFNETGVRITIVSGQEEADLIYQGIVHSCSFIEDGIVMDIGGGSTEFIHIKEHKAVWAESFDIGVSRIFQQFSFSNPITQEEIEVVNSYFDENTNGKLDIINAAILIGSSGTFETLYELAYEKPFPKGLKAIEIPIEDIIHVCKQLLASTQQQRDANKWIIPIRKKMAPIAAIKILWVINKCNVQRCLISPASLKEGCLLSL